MFLHMVGPKQHPEQLEPHYCSPAARPHPVQHPKTEIRDRSRPGGDIDSLVDVVRRPSAYIYIYIYLVKHVVTVFSFYF